MAETDEERAVPIEWEYDTDFKTFYATNVVVQHTPHEFLLTFFEVHLPLLLGSEEEKRKAVEAISSVKARGLARVIVSPGRMREFVQVMQDNLKTFDARFASGHEEGE